MFKPRSALVLDMLIYVMLLGTLVYLTWTMWYIDSYIFFHFRHEVLKDEMGHFQRIIHT